MSATLQPADSGGFVVDESAFAVLANARRRAVLRSLRVGDRPVAVADLARDVAASERDVGVRSVSEEAAERVYVSLHHAHLPKLVDEGYLRYDDERSTVSLTADGDALAPLLDEADRLAE